MAWCCVFATFLSRETLTAILPKKNLNMKIGTWNLERLKYYKKTAEITSLLESQNCDILVLTEYDERIKPKGFEFEISTKNVAEVNTEFYQVTEKRVKIFTKYEIIKEFETYDCFTSCCAELKTEIGNLLIYGTIIGIYGNRNQNFKDDLPKQIADFNKFSKTENLCIIGDYNISFCDNYYFTNLGRTELNKSFVENKINNLTENIKETIDHIAISNKFIENSKVEIAEWNCGKALSDHKGISIKLKKEKNGS